jgi:hypothetical protein
VPASPPSGGGAGTEVTVVIAVYSNRLGCVGSILVSLVGTAVLALAVWLLGR